MRNSKHARNRNGSAIGKPKHRSLIEPLERRVLLTVFVDDFNRPDSSRVGNGWLDTLGNTGGNLVIHSNEVSAPAPNGTSGIYRPFSFATPVTISATLKEENGYGGLLRRYTSNLSIANDGTLLHGYGLNFSRGDQNYPSAIYLFDGSTTVGSVTPSFQFGPAINTSFTILPDGSVVGSVSEGTDVFNFSFGPHAILSTGSNFSYATGFADPRSGTITNPRLDDLKLVSATVAPPTVTLADPVDGGLVPVYQLNQYGIHHFVDVLFQAAPGSTIEESSITDDLPEFVLSGNAAAAVHVANIPTPVAGLPGTYRYTFSGDFAGGVVKVDFLAGACVDLLGTPSEAHKETFVSAGQSILGEATRDKGRRTVDVDIERVGATKLINPRLPTWIVIHGRDSNALKMTPLATFIDGYKAGDQVLTLDWEEGAKPGSKTDFQGEDWIMPVAGETASLLKDYGFKPQQLSLVGHSWGAYVSDELAKVIGAVDTIIALDAPIDVEKGIHRVPDDAGILWPLHGGTYNPEAHAGEADPEIDFDRDSNFSWAFRADTTHLGPGRRVLSKRLGSAKTLSTANESFFVANTDHFTIIDFLENVVIDNNHSTANKVSQLFSLQRLLDHQRGAWIDNKYSANGEKTGELKFEAVIDTSFSRPTSILFFDKKDGAEKLLLA